jgi:hypothetical protein
LKFAFFVGDFVGNYELPTNADGLYPSVESSVFVAFPVNILQLFVKCRRTVSVGMDISDSGISSKYFAIFCEMPMDV